MNLIKKISLYFLLCIAAFSYSQSKDNTITISFDNIPLSEAIQRIEKVCSFTFFYDAMKIDLKQKVSLNAKNTPVKKAITDLLANTTINFEITNSQIVLFQSKPVQLTNPDPPKSKKITGLVTDIKGDPIIGANIIVKGTNIGTITDFNGNFSLEASRGSNLLISYIGYLPTEIVISDKNNLKVELLEDTKNLEEVVVVGYGTAKKGNLTGAVSMVKGKDLTVAPAASTTNLLTGRVSGLITKQTSGLPGQDAASLSIRGFGNPLVIVDGVESSFNMIDANEIENISVLKDASAAIYGARAGNGVVLVTTKRGKEGKPTITVNSSYTLQSPTIFATPASSGQLAEMRYEAHIQAGLPASTVKYQPFQIEKFYQGTDPNYPNTKWYNYIFRPYSPQNQHNLSIRGGNDKIKYFGFFSLLDQESMIKRNGFTYNRFNVRSNVDAKVTKQLSMSVDLAYILENNNGPARSIDGIWQDFWYTEPFYPSTLPDASKIAYANGGGTGGAHISSNTDLSGFNEGNTTISKLQVAFKYDIDFVKGLYAKALIDYNSGYRKAKIFNFYKDTYLYDNSADVYTKMPSASSNMLTQTFSDWQSIMGQFSLNYEKSFNTNHNFSGFVLAEIIDSKGTSMSAYREKFETTSIPYLFAGGLENKDNNGSAWEAGRLSFITRLNYSYKSKYLLETTFRYDASAKYAPEKRWGLFPSVSLGWRISEENFMKENTLAISNLKLRGGLSQTGDDGVASFAYLSGYNFGSAYIAEGKVSTGLISKGLPNPMLTWEVMNLYNCGFDFGFFKNKLYGEFDVFYRLRQGIPGTRNSTIPDTFGASLPIVNLNAIDTRGFEFMLGTTGNIDKLKYDIAANISWSRSKWNYIEEPVYTDPDQIRVYKNTGKWIDRQLGYESAGLFTSEEQIKALTYFYLPNTIVNNLKPGDVILKDQNDDGVLNYRDYVEIGKGNTPHWMGGLNVNLSYKNFDLSALFQGAFGYTYYLNLYTQDVNPDMNSGYTETVYRYRWTELNNNPNALVPRLGGANSNTWASNYNFIDGSYLRLKTFSVGYNLNAKTARTAGFESARVYVAGNNLVTISKLNTFNIDPEAPNGSSSRYFPQMKTLTLGLNLSF
jgi:TonB-linked SusC/RagA family outer membrane protein